MTPFELTKSDLSPSNPSAKLKPRILYFDHPFLPNIPLYTADCKDFISRRKIRHG